MHVQMIQYPVLQVQYFNLLMAFWMGYKLVNRMIMCVLFIMYDESMYYYRFLVPVIYIFIVLYLQKFEPRVWFK